MKEYLGGKIFYSELFYEWIKKTCVFKVLEGMSFFSSFWFYMDRKEKPKLEGGIILL